MKKQPKLKKIYNWDDQPEEVKKEFWIWNELPDEVKKEFMDCEEVLMESDQEQPEEMIELEKELKEIQRKQNLKLVKMI